MQVQPLAANPQHQLSNGGFSHWRCSDYADEWGNLLYWAVLYRSREERISSYGQQPSG